MLSSWQAIARVHLVHTVAMITARCQVAADIWTKPMELELQAHL